MIPDYHNIHNCFKLNGYHPNRDTLFQLAYSFIKEGEAFEKEIGIFLLDWLDEKDFIETETSGTTGKPKLIQIKKQAMVNSAIATGNFFKLNPTDKALHCLPARFIAGKMMLVRAIILGLELDLVHPNGTFFHKLHQYYDFVAMVPIQVENNLKCLVKIKKLIIGGAKPSHQLIKELKKQKNTKVYETYGMTETITHIAAKEINKSNFKIFEGVKIDSDERNCLVIQAKRISEEKIITNDVVEIVSKNQFKWLGRIDNVINSGGIKLFPEQIEEKLQSKIDLPFFINYESDEKLGNKVVLVIQNEKEIVLPKDTFEVLEKYERPKAIYFVPTFFKTQTDKINRKRTVDLIKKGT